MRTITLTEKSDQNTTEWYLTIDGDIVSDPCVGDNITARVITHGFYPGSIVEWKQWILDNI